MHRLHAQWISSGRKGGKAFQGFFALLLGLSVFDGVAPPVQASEPAPKELIAQFEMGVTSRPRWRRSELAREGNGRRQAGFVREQARSYRRIERVIERSTG